MYTIAAEDQKKISDYLDTHVLPVGLGTEESACSIAAINLVLSGKLTDQVPDCMSYVIGRWIIRVQDAMPDEMRNSAKWKSLLPLAAGTGRNSDDEKRRMNLILGWMWDTVLPYLSPIAEKRGYGKEWEDMCEKKDREHALIASKSAAAYAAAAAAAASVAAYAYAAPADAAAAAAYAAAAAAAAAAKNAAWEHFDPCSLLEKLVDA